MRHFILFIYSSFELSTFRVLFLRDRGLPDSIWIDCFLGLLTAIIQGLPLFDSEIFESHDIFLVFHPRFAIVCPQVT